MSKEKIIVVQKNGLMQFVTGERKSWQMWKKPILLSPFNAKTFALIDALYLKDRAEDVFHENFVFTLYDGLLSDGTYMSRYKYYVVASESKFRHKAKYYAYDKEYFSKKLGRRISEPVFDFDINNAEFIKSKKYADELVNRCRQLGSEKTAVMEVYVYRANELLEKNIVVALRHKENKEMKPQFLRSNAKLVGKFTKTNRLDQALRLTYDEYLDIYEQFQALHKQYMVLPKIIRKGEYWSGKAKDIDGRESVQGTLKLGKN